ncbi:211_t:CDS:2 [Paraglomus brasilianum]|uniref:211_t:CDS:1 n=1 Tax=Paraglomus brasilianum TaxID=144538 RepID=A0A9N9G8S4_9GLOM|nr:211_t:CDS:2 [Paraglomus brasilianum]
MPLLQTKPRQDTVSKPHKNSQEEYHGTKMSGRKLAKLHIPFFHNTARTAPATSDVVAPLPDKKNSLSQRRQTLVQRTDSGRKRNVIWSDTVNSDLVANISATELNRQEVIFEIIRTEEEYVRDLRLIEQHFIQKIKEEEQTYRNKQLPENLNKIFNSISYFLFIHEVISTCLRERQEQQEPLVRNISDILSAYAWVFRAYAPYLIHYEAALRELNDSIRKKDKLGRRVKKQQKLGGCRNLPLTTYLLKPFQRLLQYPLLIQNLLKCTNRDGPDYEDTVTLKKKLDGILKDVEEQKLAHENKQRLRELESRIHGLGEFKLAVDNRQLLGERPACQKSDSLMKKPSLKKSLTVASDNPKRQSVRNLYALNLYAIECNDIVLLAEKTGTTNKGLPIYRLISRPPSRPKNTMHKTEDSGFYSD